MVQCKFKIELKKKLFTFFLLNTNVRKENTTHISFLYIVYCALFSCTLNHVFPSVTLYFALLYPLSSHSNQLFGRTAVYVNYKWKYIFFTPFWNICGGHFVQYNIHPLILSPQVYTQIFRYTFIIIAKGYAYEWNYIIVMYSGRGIRSTNRMKRNNKWDKFYAHIDYRGLYYIYKYIFR